jgi:Kdo-III transferase WaaZ
MLNENAVRETGVSEASLKLFSLFRFLASWLDHNASSLRARRFSRKLYRCSFARSFKHLTHGGTRFALKTVPGNEAQRSILWDGKIIGCTASLAAIRNAEAGSCFILATGPSIKQLDLTKLRGHKVLGVNGAIIKLQELQIRPDYYVISDDDFAVHRFELLRQAVATDAKCFFSPSVLAAICEQEPKMLQCSNIFLIEPVNQRFGFPRLNDPAFRALASRDSEIILRHPPVTPADQIGFSKNLQKGLFAAGSVVCCAVQVAYYVGFRRIFILGMDLDYSGANPRFYEAAAQMRPTQIAQQYEPVIKPAFEVLRDFCSREDLKVFNLSNKSRLPEEIMPRKSLEQAVNETCFPEAARVV